MKKSHLLIAVVVCVTTLHSVAAQDSGLLIKTKETIEKKNMYAMDRFVIPIGRSDFQIVGGWGSRDTLALCLLDEESYIFLPYFKKMFIAPQRKLYNYNVLDSLIFYSESIFDENDLQNYGYKLLFVKLPNNEILLDSILYWDKSIHSSFSDDGKKLIVNTMDIREDVYNPAQDDQFIVYDVEKLSKGEVEKYTIPCLHCSNGHLVGRTLFFNRAKYEPEEWMAFDWRDIYMAPCEHLEDSVKIAFRSTIKAITPDGKYILAERYDMSNGDCIIIDVEAKKYQLLLGRYYNRYPAFYSYAKEKFAFDFGEYIVYIDFPTEYPFDALKENLQFWNNSFKIKEEFQHKSLEWAYKDQQANKE